jgi:hypothetical protein
MICRLAAKLARAEDAAKRLLVKGDKTVKGGAATKLYEMEGELQRLTDENVQLKHKLARYRANFCPPATTVYFGRLVAEEYVGFGCHVRERKAVEVLRDRNKELDLQVRKALADYQRLLRANKNPRNTRYVWLTHTVKPPLHCTFEKAPQFVPLWKIDIRFCG